MLLEGDGVQVSCVCAVDGRVAGFQIDCGSTFSQIVPSLAPRRVPRLGLGSAQCLGRRLWFPTCDVLLAPADAEGNLVAAAGSSGLWGTSSGVMASTTEADRHPETDIPLTRVQVGPQNLLGLRELRRWQVQLTFGPTADCASLLALTAVPSAAMAAASMRRAAAVASSAEGPDEEEEDDLAEEGAAAGTVPLADALRAAEVLNGGEVAPEDAVSEAFPWLVDVQQVLRRLHRPALYHYLVPAARAPQARPAVAGAVPVGSMRAPMETEGPSTSSSVAAAAAAVLFGTADALVSAAMPLPQLPWPCGSRGAGGAPGGDASGGVRFCTPDALVSATAPTPLLPWPHMRPCMGAVDPAAVLFCTPDALVSTPFPPPLLPWPGTVHLSGATCAAHVLLGTDDALLSAAPLPPRLPWPSTPRKRGRGASQSPAGPPTQAVLFGTADALVSDTMLPPLLPWP